MKILGFYEKLNLTLVEQNGVFIVADKQNRNILYKGDEETSTKLFTLMMARFVEKEALSV